MKAERIDVQWAVAVPRAFNLTCGAATTVLLFWVMQALIGIPSVIPDVESTPKVIFERVIKDSEPVTAPPKALVKPTPPEPMPPIPRDASPFEDAGVLGVEPVIDVNSQTIIEEATGLHRVGGGSRTPVPVVRVEPDYPPQALRAGIEGYVDLQFWVTAAGTVEDVRVIGAEPAHTFERAAVRAVRKWRYAPVEEASQSEALRIRLEFELPRDGRR